MKRSVLGLIALIGVGAVIVVANLSLKAQRAWQAPPGIQQHGVSVPDGEYLEWPLPAADQKYGAIDGHHLHDLVVEQAKISERYRDQGHPKFWGRIIGTSADQEAAEWMAAKFKALGMTDVRIQPFDLVPQWMPQTWTVTVTAGGKTKELESAQPYYYAKPLPAGGVDLEAVYVGL